VVPWSSWTNGHNGIFTGVNVYQRRTAPYLKPHMEKLAHAQRPETLFITCTDSRVVPNIITSSGPGDLFTVRNVGNLVPEDQRDRSIEAAIAFAVDKLDVTSIVVCGHSSCGAMNAVLQGGAPRSEADEQLSRWLSHGNAALVAFDDGNHPVARSAAEAGFGRVDQLGVVNVATQVETLQSHPLVRGRARLEVVGLFYDIPSASVLRVTPRYVDLPGAGPIQPAKMVEVHS
jgi:carbonic anhydrase